MPSVLDKSSHARTCIQVLKARFCTHANEDGYLMVRIIYKINNITMLSISILKNALNNGLFHFSFNDMQSLTHIKQILAVI